MADDVKINYLIAHFCCMRAYSMSFAHCMRFVVCNFQKLMNMIVVKANYSVTR